MELQRLFCGLQKGIIGTETTAGLVKAMNINPAIQQDADEFLLALRFFDLLRFFKLFVSCLEQCFHCSLIPSVQDLVKSHFQVAVFLLSITLFPGNTNFGNNLLKMQSGIVLEGRILGIKLQH